MGTTMGTHWKYFLLLLWFSYLLVSGVLLFVRGFLLSRVSLPNKAQTETQPREPRPHKAILLVIDALRYDFLFYNASLQQAQALPFQNKVSVVHELVKATPSHSRLYKFVADPPTTTMQRLKAITTGSLPTFIDVGSNFATPEINEDNIIDQLTGHNKTSIFMGDDTWTGLYPHRFLREFAYPSFNVWDLDTVDNGIRHHLLPQIKRNDWHLFVAHFLGVDHCGHRYGPYHSEMGRKLKEMDTVIREVVRAMDESTVLFVIGDHGMTATGDHGGGTEAEVSAAMFVYSPKPLLSVEPTLHSDIVSQVDLVPTLAAVLGIPIPFSNLGTVILDALPSSDSTDWRSALLILWSNVQQTTNYIRQYSVNKKEFSVEKLAQLQKMYDKLQEQVQNVPDKAKFKHFASKAKEYLLFLRKMCEEVWVEFDPMAISRGLLLTFFSIFLCFLMVDGLPADVLNSTFLLVGYTSMFVSVAVCVLCYNLELLNNLEQNIYFSTGIVSIFLMTLVIIQNWAPIVNTWNQQCKLRDWSNVASRMLLLLTLLGMFSNSFIVEEAHVLSYFLLTLTWLLVYNLKFMKSDSIKHKFIEKSSAWFRPQVAPVKLKVVSSVLCLSTLIRVSQYYWRCREEQVACESFVTHKPLSSGTLVEGKYRNAECLCTLFCLALFATVTRMWLRSCGNLVGFSLTVTLARYSPTVIVICTGGFWILQGLPKDMKVKFFLPWHLQFLPWVIYSIMGTVLVSLFVHPLYIYTLPKIKNNFVSVYGQESAIPQLFHQVKQMIEKHNKSNRGDTCALDDKFPVIYGLATVYSATFIILGVFLCLLVALLLGDVLAPASVLMAWTSVGLVTILGMLQYEKAALTAQLFRVPWYSVVCWGFLSVYFFYGTGHQPTFPSIQWDAAFVGTGGQFSNYIVPGLLIGINTFSSHLLMGLMLPLVLFAPFTLRVMCPKLFTTGLEAKAEDTKRGELVLLEREDLLFRGMFIISTKYLLFHGIRMFACMLAATIHCRHLMVWKIFAPKMIFEGLGLFVTIASVLVAFILVIRITRQVEKAFSRLLDENR